MWIGEHPLTGMPVESFFAVEFDLPQVVVDALQESYDDLRIKLILNVPSNASGEYVLDGFKFGEVSAPVILLGSDRERALVENRTSFSTVGDSIALLGQILSDYDLSAVSLQLNNEPIIAPTLDGDNKFEKLLSLSVDPNEFLNTNGLEVVATDINGNTTTVNLVIESMGIRVPKEIAVLFKAETDPADYQAVLDQVNGTVIASLNSRTNLVEVPAGTELQAVDTLIGDDAIRAALPNFPVHPAAVPNDMSYPDQWDLPRIGAPDAWDVTVGSEDIVVAVLDSGVLYDNIMFMSHPCDNGVIDWNAPMMSNLWLNEDECCLTPPCESLCYPSEPAGSEDECPRADLNNDGCPGICGVDDDGDGLADYSDPDVIALFSNGRDDDGDGLIDEQGPGNTPCSNVTPAQMVGAASHEDCDGAANDDDENGYPDDCRGFQFGRRQGMLEDYWGQPVAPNNPTDLKGGTQDPYTVIGHGTMTAEVIGELGDNCFGYAGVAWRATIMPLGVGRYQWNNGVRSLDPTPDFFSILEAYEYAAENGANITNASIHAPCNCLPAGDPSCVWECPWGTALSQDVAEDQMSLFLSETASQNVLHIVAAGNAVAGGTGEDLDTHPTVSFPQRVQLPNVMLVSASNIDDNRADFSHYGGDTVHIAAPGDNLAFHGGTSAAAPHVAGAAVLVMDAMPELKGDPERVITLLEDTATQLPQWQGIVRSGGILNVAAAVQGTPDPISMFSDESDEWLTRGARDLLTNDVDLFDMDGDGDLDMLEAPCNPAGATLAMPRVLINDGGQFHDESFTRWPDLMVSHCDADFGDINGDGHLDVVAGGYYPFDETSQANQNRIYLNDGSGNFVLGAAGMLPAELNHTRAVALCDLDSNGVLDLVAGDLKALIDPSHRVNRIYMNDGAGVFTDETASRLLNVNRPEVGAPSKIVCAELTQPLSAVCNPSETICQLCADPSRSLSEIAASGEIADMIACESIRQSIAPEIVIANTQGTITRYFVNQGNGVFNEATDDLNLPVISGVRQEHDVEVADFNGDTALDLMFVTVRGARNFMMLNQGNGVFEEAPPQPIFYVEDWAREVEVADFDNDGDLDIVVLRGDPNAAVPGYHSYYRNDGGTWNEVPAGIDTLYLLTTDGDVADIDGDGDVDMIIGNSGAMNQIMLNNTIVF